MRDVPTRYGSLKVPDGTRDLIGRFLLHYGEWAWDEVSFVASVLPDDARVLDIGACLGTFGLGLSRAASLSRLCLVEANPAVMPYLRKNVESLAPEGTRVRHCLAGSTDAVIASPHGDPDNIGSVSYADSDAQDLDAPPPPPPVSLSTLREEEGPFDLVKIDAEGMELSIVQSDAAHIATGQTTLWLECNEDRRSLELCATLLSWGLEIHYFAFPSHNPDNFNRRDTAIFPCAYEAGLLVSPRKAPVLGDPLKAHGCLLRAIPSVEALRDALWKTPRWGLAEWEGQEGAAIAALAGHALRDEHFASFLSPGWEHGTLLSERCLALEARLEASDHARSGAEKALAEADERCAGLARSLETETAAIREARREIGRLEAQLAERAARTYDQLAETGLEAETRIRPSIEARLQNERRMIPVPQTITASTEQLAHLQQRIFELETSTVWRLTSPIRHLAVRHPLLRRSARVARRCAARIRDKLRHR